MPATFKAKYEGIQRLEVIFNIRALMLCIYKNADVFDFESYQELS